MATERVLSIYFLFYFLRIKSKTTFAEGINICVRSNRKLKIIV